MNADRDLLHTYTASRSEAAFTALVERHIGLVYSVALRHVGGDAHLARDIAQSVFIDLARKAPRLPHTTVLAAWLYTSTRFAAAKTVRSERRRRAHEQASQLMKENECNPSDLAWRQVQPVLDDVLSALGQEDREAVILRFFDNKSYRQIGDELSLKDDTARMRVERALQKLASILERRGITSTAEALGAVLTANAAGAAPVGLVQTITTGVFHAGTPALTASALKTLTFMSTTKTVGAVAAAGVVMFLALELQNLRQETNSLRDLSLLLGRQATALEAKIQNQPSPTDRQNSSGESKITSATEALKDYSDRNLLGEPEHAVIVARRHRRYAMGNYKHAIDALNLSPPETERLKELIAARWLAEEDAGDVLDRMDNVALDVRKKAQTEARSDAERKLNDLLGPERSAKLQEEYDVSSERGTSWRLFTDFWDAGISLTPDQKTALARVLARERAASPPGPDASPIDPKTLLRSRDQFVLESAAAFLTPEQLALLRDRRRDDNRYRQIVRERKPVTAPEESAHPRS